MLEVLVSKGYFPQELPDVFTARSFGEASNVLYRRWLNERLIQTSNIRKNRKTWQGCYSYKICETEPERLTKPKRGYERRTISIPHPIPHLALSYEIAHNWRTIAKWLARSKFTIDRVRIDSTSNRATPGINFALHQAKKNFIEASSDWLVTTDITRFYPSIYTHSIAWAAYGKDKVKANRAHYTGSLADRIDQLVRLCNRNQTIGIPIGPDTSHILAEIISSRIDSLFYERASEISSNNIDRLQDDWFIGESSLERSETTLSILNHLYREFELDINGTKTSIDQTVHFTGEQWISEIKAFLSHRADPLRRKRLSEFLDLGVRLQAENMGKPVTQYVLSVIEGIPFSDDDLEKVESFLLKAAIISPVSMDAISRIIINYAHFERRVSKKRIAERFTQLAERNLENGREFEAMWQIYTIRGMRALCNSSRLSDIVEEFKGATIPLILLDMKDSNLFVRKLPKDTWQSRISKESVTSESTWLLAYEGFRNGWLVDKERLMDEPFFKSLSEENVFFYDKRKNVKKSSSIKRRRSEIQKLTAMDMKKALLLLRGFRRLTGSFL